MKRLKKIREKEGADGAMEVRVRIWEHIKKMRFVIYGFKLQSKRLKLNLYSKSLYTIWFCLTKLDRFFFCKFFYGLTFDS